MTELFLSSFLGLSAVFLSGCGGKNTETQKFLNGKKATKQDEEVMKQITNAENAQTQYLKLICLRKQTDKNSKATFVRQSHLYSQDNSFQLSGASDNSFRLSDDVIATHFDVEKCGCKIQWRSDLRLPSNNIVGGFYIEPWSSSLGVHTLVDLEQVSSNTNVIVDVKDTTTFTVGNVQMENLHLHVNLAGDMTDERVQELKINVDDKNENTGKGVGKKEKRSRFKNRNKRVVPNDEDEVGNFERLHSKCVLNSIISDEFEKGSTAGAVTYHIDNKEKASRSDSDYFRNRDARYFDCFHKHPKEVSWNSWSA